MTPANISFKQSLLAKKISGKISIIAECKKASPSFGVIRQHYNPVEIALIYEKAGTAAISVLTDELYFQGSVADLQKVVKAVNIPVLRKDFILDFKQIQEARKYGASAILLIVRILSPSQLKELQQFSASLGMDSLVEIHTEKEAEIALDAGVEIIGINTRDLDTFQIHEDLVERIFPMIPSGIVKIAESGIHSSHDLLNAAKYADTALIGSYFMQASSIEDAFGKLTKF